MEVIQKNHMMSQYILILIMKKEHLQLMKNLMEKKPQQIVVVI